MAMLVTISSEASANSTIQIRWAVRSHQKSLLKKSTLVKLNHSEWFSLRKMRQRRGQIDCGYHLVSLIHYLNS